MLTCAALLASACAGRASLEPWSSSVRAGADRSVLTASGDWDDLDASVQAGAEQSEAAVVHPGGKPSDPSRTYELRSAVNEPITLTSVRGPAHAIELTCRWGRMGNAAHERLLLARVARRLSDLKGVEFAPIRE